MTTALQLTLPTDHPQFPHLLNASPSKTSLALTIADKFLSISEEFSHNDIQNKMTQDNVRTMMNVLSEKYTDKVSTLEEHIRHLEVELQILKNTQQFNIDKALLEQKSDTSLLENKLVDALNAKFQLSQEVNKLKEMNSQLLTPMSKGNIGEFTVASVAENIGFNVQDTSNGLLKNSGHLDLLLTKNNIRLAIEVKNKQSIGKASLNKVEKGHKDISDDIRTFQNRVRDGLKNNLFDAAVFISIRAPSKMGQPVTLEMNDDFVPIMYLGTENGSNAPHLSQEQIESQLYMMLSLVEHSRRIHAQFREISQHLSNDDLQIIFDKAKISITSMSTLLNSTFDELNLQEKHIHSMNDSLTNIRIKCIKLFRHILAMKFDNISQIIAPPWVQVFEHTKQNLMDNPSEKNSILWNKVNRNKTCIERSVSKDAFLAAIRDEIQADFSNDI